LPHFQIFKLIFHCSRHTFAIVSLSLGMKLPVISNVLGHTNSKTTDIYAKVEDPLKYSEMDKWNV